MRIGLKFTNRVPDSWKGLQDLVAEYLIVAGYRAITPCELSLIHISSSAYETLAAKEIFNAFIRGEGTLSGATIRSNEKNIAKDVYKRQVQTHLTAKWTE